MMVSSGICIGSFDYLKWKRITSVKNEKGDIMAAKIVVYGGDRRYVLMLDDGNFFNTCKLFCRYICFTPTTMLK